jgi:hypothetical protein
MVRSRGSSGASLNRGIWSVLGRHRQETDRVEDFEVAVDLWIELGTVDDGVIWGFQRFFCGK